MVVSFLFINADTELLKILATRGVKSSWRNVEPGERKIEWGGIQRCRRETTQQESAAQKLISRRAATREGTGLYYQIWMLSTLIFLEVDSLKYLGQVFSWGALLEMIGFAERSKLSARNVASDCRRLRLHRCWRPNVLVTRFRCWWKVNISDQHQWCYITFWHIMMSVTDWNVTNIFVCHQHLIMVTIIKSPT